MLRLRLLPIVLWALVLLGDRVALGQWLPLGPDGGDVRSLAYDPHNPEHIYLGTSAGQLFVSDNGGSSWGRFAELGSAGDYVLDHIAIDPNSGTMYVAAWSVEQKGGDLFRSADGGRTWQTLPGMHGKSIRAMALAASAPETIVAGALDGVFRSPDGGNTWDRISPANHTEIKNIESVAIDPHNPNVIYAGTFHLPWKTEDGGRHWHSIKRGVIDDSDVFSIILDARNSRTVYLSACSGIYKSETAAESFRKVRGIPYSANRTRVLKQDPAHPNVVYAGTTEGLWKTTDAGKTWRRVTAPNIIVNDIYVDPRHPNRVLLATDHSGVLASNDAGGTFVPSNRGFAHRQVWSVLPDRFDPRTLYAGLVNDKEFGGVFVSHDEGRLWRQINAGILKLDVFALAQADNGDLLAGTNRGIYKLARGSAVWQPVQVVARRLAIPTRQPRRRTQEKRAAPPRVEWVKEFLNGPVAQLQLAPRKWFAATSEGLFMSRDQGKSWYGGRLLGYPDCIAVQISGKLVMAVTPRAVLISKDDGDTWTPAPMPSYITELYGGAVVAGNPSPLPQPARRDQSGGVESPDSGALAQDVLWLATREGAFRSFDLGLTWEHVLEGLPARNVTSLTYDSGTQRLFAISEAGRLYASSNAGQSWQPQEVEYTVRSLIVGRGRLLAATAFDGVIARPESDVQRTAAATDSSGNN